MRSIDIQKQFVGMPRDLVRAGRLVSNSAFRVYACIASFSRDTRENSPGIRALRAASGLATEALTRALRELIAKRLIDCVSGQAERDLNVYVLLPREVWDLGQPKPKAGQRDAVSKIETEGNLDFIFVARRSFENRNTKVSKIETDTVSKIENVLDHSLDHKNKRGSTHGVTNDPWQTFGSEAKKGVTDRSTPPCPTEGGKKDGAWAPGNYPNLAAAYNSVIQDFTLDKKTAERRIMLISKHFGKTTYAKPVSKKGEQKECRKNIGG